MKGQVGLYEGPAAVTETEDGVLQAAMGGLGLGLAGPSGVYCSSLRRREALQVFGAGEKLLRRHRPV